MSDSARDDERLIAQAQAGDRAAFDALVRKYEQKAYTYAYRLTRNPEDAADIVVEAFSRVYSALKNFRGQSAFGTWLYRILTNCSLDHRKRDKSSRNVSLDSNITVDGGEVERQIEDERDTPDIEAERSARETTIQKALADMPDYQQAMLVMYHVEMLSYEEIADALDLPIGTVKSRLNRARLALRDHLAKDQELFQIG
jgi:RNA polymerase sigma-70 factor (ECF subfamily)